MDIMIITPKYVGFREYWKLDQRDRPKTFEELCEMLLPDPGIRGIWEINAIDARTGRILQKSWVPNAITDNGAKYAIGNLFDSAGAVYGPMKYLCISTDGASSSLTSALTATTTYTSLSVASLPNAIPANAKIKIDYNTGSEEIVVTTVGASAGATSITGITAVGGGAYIAAFNHSIGATVVPVASETDNPSSTPTGGQYQTLLSGDYSSITGTGQGNRTRTITKTFLGASTTAGSYNWARLSNANPIVTGSTGASSIIPTAIINSTTNQEFRIVIKL
jgi:hypothetical protein